MDPQFDSMEIENYFKWLQIGMKSPCQWMSIRTNLAVEEKQSYIF